MARIALLVLLVSCLSLKQSSAGALKMGDTFSAIVFPKRGINNTRDESVVSQSEKMDSEALSDVMEIEIDDTQDKSTMQGFGDMAVKIMDTLKRDGKKVNFEAITEMISELSRAAVRVNHPKQVLGTDVYSQMKAYKREVKHKIENLQKENKRLRKVLGSEIKAKNKHGLHLNLSKPTNSSELKVFAFSRQYLNTYNNIHFNNVVKNDLPGYNPAYYFLICPDSGHYFVSVIIEPQRMTRNQISVDVRLRNEVLFSVAAMSVQNYWNSGSGAVITHCQEGDKIWAVSTGSGRLEGGRSHYGSMFHIYRID